MTKLTKETDSLLIKCSCCHADHLVEFTVDDYTYMSHARCTLQLTVRVMLNPSMSFFSRLYIALRYLFRSPGRSFYFESVAISDLESIESLERLILRFKALYKLRQSGRRDR